MQVNRSALRSFLIENGVSDTAAARAMAALEGHFRQAESGRFSFGPTPDVEAVKEAIALATGGKVETVVFISVSQPFPKPDWMNEAAFVAGVRISLRTSSLRDSLRDRPRAIQPESLWANLGDRLQASLRVTLWQSLWLSLGDSLWVSLWVSLCFYIGFVQTGNLEQAAKLEPLVRLTATNPVLGEKADEPGTWLVLTA